MISNNIIYQYKKNHNLVKIFSVRAIYSEGVLQFYPSFSTIVYNSFSDLANLNNFLASLVLS